MKVTSIVGSTALLSVMFLFAADNGPAANVAVPSEKCNAAGFYGVAGW